MVRKARLICQAVFFYLLVEIRLRREGFGGVVLAFNLRQSDHQHRCSGAAGIPLHSRRCLIAADKVAQLLPWNPSCLVRCLVAQRMMFLEHTQARLCLGVPAKSTCVGTEDKPFEAHAWLEVDGDLCLAEGVDISEYRQIAVFTVLDE